MKQTDWKWVNGNTVGYKFFTTFGSDLVCAVNFFKNVEHYFALKKLGWREDDG